MSDELNDRIVFFRTRLLDRLREQTALGRKMVQDSRNLREAARRLADAVQQVQVSSLRTQADRALMLEVAAADQSLAGARQDLEQNDASKLIIRIELEQLVRAVEQLDHAEQMIANNRTDEAEAVCRSLGLID